MTTYSISCIIVVETLDRGYLVEERKAKVLIYDIECTGHLGYSYGLWDTQIHKVIEYPIMLSFSYTWYEPGKKPVIINKGLNDYGSFKKDRKNDKELARELWHLFNEADITLGHNSKQFDDKMARMFFLKHDFEPPSPTKSIDTKQAAKAIGRFGSNSLNSLSDFFGFGSKTKETHADLWWDCLLGDKTAWRKMKKYNQQDVVLTIKLYEKLRPWILNHPNMARLTNRPDACPKCGSTHWESAGWRTTNVTRFRRYRCVDCGGYASQRRGADQTEDVKPTYVNYPN